MIFGKTGGTRKSTDQMMRAAAKVIVSLLSAKDVARQRR